MSTGPDTSGEGVESDASGGTGAGRRAGAGRGSGLGAATRNGPSVRGRRAVGLPPFEAVVAEHGPAVLRFCVARNGPHAGEDAFQEAMISALRAYPDLRDPGAVRGWLFSIAHRKTIDAGRAEHRRPRPAGGPEAVEAVATRDTGAGATAPATTLAAPPTDRSDPLAGTVWVHVRTLPRKQQEAVTLRYLADLTNTEIASVMETSPEAARRNVFEGLRRLRDLVDRAPA